VIIVNLWDLHIILSVCCQSWFDMKANFLLVNTSSHHDRKFKNNFSNSQKHWFWIRSFCRYGFWELVIISKDHEMQLVDFKWLRNKPQPFIWRMISHAFQREINSSVEGDNVKFNFGWARDTRLNEPLFSRVYLETKCSIERKTQAWTTLHRMKTLS
jgi:hypothetical protein